MKSFLSGRLNLLTLYLPKASKTQIKAGLLTCFVCTTFPPPSAVVIKSVQNAIKLTATGIVSDFHRSSLFILGADVAVNTLICIQK